MAHSQKEGRDGERKWAGEKKATEARQKNERWVKILCTKLTKFITMASESNYYAYLLIDIPIDQLWSSFGCRLQRALWNDFCAIANMASERIKSHAALGDERIIQAFGESLLLPVSTAKLCHLCQSVVNREELHFKNAEESATAFTHLKQKKCCKYALLGSYMNWLVLTTQTIW